MNTSTRSSAYKEVPLGGKDAAKRRMKVSPEDLERVSRLSWHVNQGRATARLKSSDGSRLVLAHRLILGEPDGEIDHINGDPLDNRRENLRVCTHAENTRNVRKHADGSGNYKGTVWDPDREKWAASLMFNGTAMHLGRFATEKEAAEYYDVAARYYFGEFAATNFPGSLALSVSDIRRRVNLGAKARRKARSRYRGVCRYASGRTKPWVAYITVNKHRMTLGYFSTEEEAARAYDAAAREHHGPAAFQNFAPE